jgi:hypothetical protein
MKKNVVISMKVQIPIEFEEKNFIDKIIYFLGVRSSKLTFKTNDRQELFISILLSAIRRRKIAKIKNKMRELIQLYGGKLFYDLNNLNETTIGAAGSEKWEVNIPKLLDSSGKETGQPNYLWNHDCVKFPEAIKDISDGMNPHGSIDLSLGPYATNIEVFHFDIGYSTHPVVTNYARYNAMEKNEGTSLNSKRNNLEGYHLLLGGYQKPGHSTATAASMIGVSGIKKEDWPCTLDIVSDELDTIYKTKISQGLFPHVNFTSLKASKTVILGGDLGLKLFNNVSDVENMIDGLDEAIKNKADVITMSLGGDFRGKKEKIIIDKVREAYSQGIIIVCAAGNSKLYSKLFGIVKPARYDETISVAALEPVMKEGKLNLIPWSKSSSGPSVDISAPGKYIYTPFELGIDKIQDFKLKNILEDGYLYKFGGATSQATVHVSAAAALWKHVYFKSLLQDEFYSQQNSKYTGTLNNRVVEAFRYGLFNSTNQLLTQKIKWTRKERLNFRGLLDVQKLLDKSLAPTTQRCKRMICEFELSGDKSFSRFLINYQPK